MSDIWKAIPLFAGLLAAALLVGCPSGGEERAPTNDTAVMSPAANGAKSAPAAPPRVRPMLDGWSKPALALVFSGEQHGYMEPCGCSLTQSGGLSRRADFLRQIEQKGWPCVALDAGGLVRKDNLQNKLKYQVMLKALKELKYQVIALGIEELGLERLEPGFLLTQGAQIAADGDTAPSLVNANVEFTLFKDEGVRPAVRSKLITVGGHKIGVTAVIGASAKSAVLGGAAEPQIVINDPAQALPAAIAELKKGQAEVLVLLAHAEKKESIELAKKFPEFQLVVTAHGPEDGQDPEHIGNTLLIAPGQKGKRIAVVGYYPENKGAPFRSEIVDLDKERFKDTPRMIALLREYQQMLGANYDSVMQDLPKSPHPSGDRFAGVESCKGCHAKAYAVWKGSKHAQAYESLITGREGTKDPVVRNRDPECLSCHATGWEPQQVYPYESGFYSAERTPHLKGQQCENCHGPLAKHVDLELRWKKDRKSTREEDVIAARRASKISVAEAQKNLCIRCHDGDNDPAFNAEAFPKYWEKIKHPFRD